MEEIGSCMRTSWRTLAKNHDLLLHADTRLEASLKHDVQKPPLALENS